MIEAKFDIVITVVIGCPAGSVDASDGICQDFRPQPVGVLNFQSETASGSRTVFEFRRDRKAKVLLPILPFEALNLETLCQQHVDDVR